MRTEKIDVLVIGAGPAGSVAAAILNKNGHKVKVVEKQKFPRFVIGESLLPLCLDNFKKAGLLEAVKKQKFQKKIGAAFIREKDEFCSFHFTEQYTEGALYAWQMPRAELDKALIDEAEKQGVEVVYEESVEGVLFEEEKVTVDIKNKAGNLYQVEAKFVIDASGYGRVLPRLLDLSQASDYPSRTAFFAHIQTGETNRENRELTEAVDFGDTSWAWIIPFSSGITSVGFVADATFFDKFPQEDKVEKYKAILQSHHKLKEKFDKNPTLVFEPKLISGYSVGVKKMYGDRFVLVGNSTEFLDPIFSSGVAFATESGVRAAELLSQQLNGQKVDWEKDYSNYMQEGINVFRSYVSKWYSGALQTIFFAEGKTPLVKRQICSVLAGYVWDKTNPYVKKHKKAVDVLAKVITMQQAAKTTSNKPK